MTRRLSVTSAAKRDLLDIWSYIAADNIDAADDFLGRIYSRCNKLVDFSASGLRRDDLSPDLFGAPIGRYTIYYRVEPKRLIVSRVLHSARRIDSTYF